MRLSVGILFVFCTVQLATPAVAKAQDYPRWPGTKCISFLGADVRQWVDPFEFEKAIVRIREGSKIVKSTEEKLAWIQLAQESSGIKTFPTRDSVEAWFSLATLKRLVNLMHHLSFADGVSRDTAKWLANEIEWIALRERSDFVSRFFMSREDRARIEKEKNDLTNSFVEYAKKTGIFRGDNEPPKYLIINSWGPSDGDGTWNEWTRGLNSTSSREQQEPPRGP